MVKERPVETEHEVDAHGAFQRQKNRFIQHLLAIKKENCHLSKRIVIA